MLLTIEADSCHVEAAIGTAVCTVIPFADGSEASASQSVMHSPGRWGIRSHTSSCPSADEREVSRHHSMRVIPGARVPSSAIVSSTIIPSSLVT